MSTFGRFCCKSPFALVIKIYFGCTGDFRVKMWGTSSPDDKAKALGVVSACARRQGDRVPPTASAHDRIWHVAAVSECRRISAAGECRHWPNARIAAGPASARLRIVPAWNRRVAAMSRVKLTPAQLQIYSNPLCWLFLTNVPFRSYPPQRERFRLGNGERRCQPP